MKDNQRFPIEPISSSSVTFENINQFSEALSDEEFENIPGAGEWRQIQLIGGFLTEATTYTEELQQYLDDVRHYVVNTFDIAITAMSLINDFLYFIPNFLNVLTTYLAQIISNALEVYLRLGMHILIVPPDFGDSQLKGFPTTDIYAQAENVYNKFYDTSDPYLPYNVPFKQDVAEKMIESGQKVQNKIEKFLLKRRDNTFQFPELSDAATWTYNPGAESESLADKWGFDTTSETLRSDFTEYNQAIRNLSRPRGVYDAIFLYLSMDYNSNQEHILKFIQSIASLANLFQLEGLNSIHDDCVKNFISSKRTKIKILTNQEMRDLPKESKIKYKRIDSYTKKQIVVDEAFSDIVVVEVDPVKNMPVSRFNRLKEHVENEIAEIENTLSITNDSIVSEQRLAITAIEEQLRNNSYLLRDRKESLQDLKDEQTFYEIQRYIIDFFESGRDIDKDDNLSELVTTILEKSSGSTTLKNQNFYSDIQKLSDDFFTYKNAQTFPKQSESQIKEYYQDLHKQIYKVLDYRSVTPLQGLFKDENELHDTINHRIANLENDISKIEEMIENEATRIYQKRVSKLTDSVQSKKEQLENLENEVNNKTPLPSLDKATNIIQFVKKYKIGNRNLYQNHLQKFYETNHRSLWSYAAQAYGISSSAITEEGKIDFSQVDTEYNTGEIPNSVPAETFIYEFVTERDGISLDRIQTGMYVHLYKTGGPGESVFLGDGFIVDDHVQNLKESAEGSWIGVNFSDLIGTTTAIKTLQKKVNSFANMFTPNDTFLTEMIRVLEDIQDQIIGIIDIIDELLAILNLSIEFEGQIWGKYCREPDLGGYDKLASDLTNVEGFISQVAKRDFEPSKHSSILYYLNLIEQIDPLEAELIRKEIDEDFNAQSDYRKRKKILASKSQEPSLIPPDITTGYSSPSVWDGYGLTKEVLETSVRTKEFVETEISNLLSAKSNVLTLGSSLWAKSKLLDFTDAETITKNRQRNKLSEYKAKIYAELSRIEPTLSNEFGFSLVFLSYLPKGRSFYPVHWLAEIWKLIDKEKEDRVNQPVDRPTADSMSEPPKTKEYIESVFSDLSNRENPVGEIKPIPIPIPVDFVPHRVVNVTNFTSSGVEDASLKTEIISPSPDYKFRIVGPLRENLHGVRIKSKSTSSGAMKFGEFPETPISTYTFRFEAEISVELDDSYVIAQSLTVDKIPRINKLEIRMGVFYYQNENSFQTHEKGKSLSQDNSTNAEVLKFSSRKKKRFISEIQNIQKIQTKNLMPYILIGYKQEGTEEQKNVNMNSLIFTIHNCEIFFFRSR